MSSIARAPNGDLLMKMSAGSASVLIRSKDNGRTWSKMEKPTWEGASSNDNLPGTIFSRSDRALFIFKADYAKPHLVLSRASSTDNAKTWSAFQPCGKITMPKKHQDQAWMYHSPFELKDGTILWVGATRSPKSFGNIGGTFYENQRMPGAMNFCLRSTDGGKTWTGPVNTDGPNPRPNNMVYAKDNHPSEISAGQAADDRVIAFVRPITSPWMWETSSTDGGKTWTPMARGPFPMWACSHVIRTASGALLIAGRHPGLAVRVSYDNGLTWLCYRIDTTSEANGRLYEVEPNVVMYASSANYADRRIRAHLIRVTPTGLDPISPKK